VGGALRERSAASRSGDPSGAVSGLAVVGVGAAGIVVEALGGTPRSAASRAGEPSGAPATFAEAASRERSSRAARVKPAAETTNSAAITRPRVRVTRDVSDPGPLTGGERMPSSAWPRGRARRRLDVIE
jgi:hypothetical protein